MGGISYDVWLGGLCAGLSWFHLLCFPTECICTTIRHTGRVTTHSICISNNSEGSKKLLDDDRLLPKHVRASLWIKELHNQCILLVVSAMSNMHGTNIKLCSIWFVLFSVIIIMIIDPNKLNQHQLCHITWVSDIRFVISERVQLVFTILKLFH
jgi:hypothetical protein